MTPDIVSWEVPGPLFEQVVSVWAAAFSQPPYCIQDAESDIRTTLGGVHSRRAGFKGVAALDAERRAIAMAYGYSGARGQWWTDHVARKLSPQSQARWLGAHFEVVEVAVRPDYQRRGIGQVLVPQLMAGRPESTCLLSTRTDAGAHVLYRKLGFETLTEMQFGENQPWYFIMGKRLR